MRRGRTPVGERRREKYDFLLSPKRFYLFVEYLNLSGMRGKQSTRKKFCSKLRAQIKDETMASGEYEALVLEALRLNLPSSKVASILFEKIRDDEQSHKKTLEKLVRSVCSIK